MNTQIKTFGRFDYNTVLNNSWFSYTNIFGITENSIKSTDKYSIIGSTNLNWSGGIRTIFIYER